MVFIAFCVARLGLICMYVGGSIACYLCYVIVCLFCFDVCLWF